MNCIEILNEKNICDIQSGSDFTIAISNKNKDINMVKSKSSIGKISMNKNYSKINNDDNLIARSNVKKRDNFSKSLYNYQLFDIGFINYYF